MLLGALEGGKLLGFVFGFPGFDADRLIIHSDMLAVKKEYRSVGLGRKLKLAQRESAMARGISEITWTFDPLQSLNAHLDFTKLGVIAEQYKNNYYGETSSFLHRNGTDRLWVRWILNSERVKERIAGGAISQAPALDDMHALVRVGEASEPITNDLQRNQANITIEIPGNINTVQEDNIELATRWRDATRSAFTEALEADYSVREFYRPTNDKGVGVYLLTRKSD